MLLLLLVLVLPQVAFSAVSTDVGNVFHARKGEA